MRLSQLEYSHPGSHNPHREAIKYRLDGSPLIGPEKRKKKAIRTKNCLSEASFFSFRFFLSIAGIGQSSGSPFLAEAKKVTAPRHERDVGAHPSPATLTLTLSRLRERGQNRLRDAQNPFHFSGV